MNRYFFILICAFSTYHVFAGIKVTNMLNDTINLSFYFENGRIKVLELAPYAENVMVYATDRAINKDEYRIMKVEARSRSRVIVDWDNMSSITVAANVQGRPIYGTKKSGKLYLNKSRHCPKKFYSADPLYEKFNGWMRKCKQSKTGLDVDQHPLEMVIIQERNQKDTDIIKSLLPSTYAVPAGIELGGLELVILARELKKS